MLFGGGLRKVRHDLVEMQMFEQLEPRRAEDVCVLQNLNGVPVAALDRMPLLSGHLTTGM